MNRVRTFTWVVVTVLLLASATAASAGVDLGAFCWVDNFGALWKLNLQSFPLSDGLVAVNGVRVVSFTCNAVREQPITGTMRFRTSTAVLGVQSVAAESGVCQGVSWHGVMPLASGTASGYFRSENGAQGTFSLVPKACPSPLEAAGGAGIDPSHSF